MESDSIRKGISCATSDAKQLLLTFLEEHMASFLGTLRFYVQRMGLAQGDEVAAVALEVLQEVAVEALSHADRFQPERQPMAWLLGIAANIIRRKRAVAVQRHRHELSLSDLAVAQSEPLSEAELLDGLKTQLPHVIAGPEEDIAANEQVQEILALVSPEDREILQLVFLYDFEREALAKRLGIRPTAARVRLHRALNRLRAAWRTQMTLDEKGEEGHA
jgi:RNA polymerase sigma factor (sigma-70 family)